MGKGGGSNLPSETTFHLTPELQTFGSHLPEGTAQSLGYKGVHIDVDPYHEDTIPGGTKHGFPENPPEIPVYPEKTPEIFGPSTQYVSEYPSLENLFNPANNKIIKKLKTKLKKNKKIKNKRKPIRRINNSYENLVEERKKLKI